MTDKDHEQLQAEAEALIREIEELDGQGLDLDDLIGEAAGDGDLSLPAGYDQAKLSELTAALDAGLPAFAKAMTSTDDRRPEIMLAAFLVLTHRVNEHLAVKYPSRAGAIEDCAAYLAEEWIARDSEAAERQEEDTAADVARRADVPIGGGL